jgi:hypothetical protein
MGEEVIVAYLKTLPLIQRLREAIKHIRLKVIFAMYGGCLRMKTLV